jgi:hypothetical protein
MSISTEDQDRNRRGAGRFDEIVQALTMAARTGKIGDGKIFDRGQWAL